MNNSVTLLYQMQPIFVVMSERIISGAGRQTEAIGTLVELKNVVNE
jgi:hypothetical protein